MRPVASTSFASAPGRIRTYNQGIQLPPRFPWGLDFPIARGRQAGGAATVKSLHLPDRDLANGLGADAVSRSGLARDCHRANRADPSRPIADRAEGFPEFGRFAAGSFLPESPFDESPALTVELRALFGLTIEADRTAVHRAKWNSSRAAIPLAPIGIVNPPGRGHLVLDRLALEPNEPSITEGIGLLQNPRVVDLARPWLMAAGIVGEL